MTVFIRTRNDIASDEDLVAAGVKPPAGDIMVRNPVVVGHRK
jgi:hypothetical protein